MDKQAKSTKGHCNNLSFFLLTNYTKWPVCMTTINQGLRGVLFLFILCQEYPMIYYGANIQYDLR